MEKIKLLRLLQSLSKSELKDLTKFIHSDYFKVAMPLIRLYDSLQKYSPLFKETQLDKPELWKKIYPKSEYSLKRLTNKMSDLTKEVERFLVIQSLETKEEKYQYQKLKAKAFNQHHLYEDFKKEVQKLIKEQVLLPHKNLKQYRELTDLYHTFYFHAKNNKIELAQLSIEEIWENQQAFNFLANLTYATEIICRQLIHGVQSEVDVVPIIKFQSSLFNDKFPLLHHLYTQLHLLLVSEKPSLTQLEEVEQLIIQNLNKIDADNKGVLLVALSNYLSRMVYEGVTEYKIKFFKIYQLIYEQGLFTRHGHLEENTFLNMINASTKYGDITWTEQFIKDAGPKLEKSIQENVTSLGWVYFYFGTQQYDKAAKTLVVLKGGSYLFKMRIGSLRIRTYYEIALSDSNYFSIFQSEATKYANFLKTESRLDVNKKTSYTNFLLFIRKLARYQQNENYSNQKKKKKILLEKLVHTKQVALREWLIEKIVE